MALVFAGVPRASAQTAADRETARSLMDRGDERLEQGQAEEALALYLGAHGIMHVPTTGIEVARTYALLDKLVEARDAALEMLRIPVAPDEPKAFRIARAEAEQLARELAGQIPLLRIEIAPPEAAQHAALSIDGRSVPPAAAGLPQALNPAEHLVQVTAPGFRAAERRLVLNRSERTSLHIALEAGGASEAPAKRTPAARAPRSGSQPLAYPPGSGREPGVRTENRLPWPVWLGAGVAGTGLVVGANASEGAVSLSLPASFDGYLEIDSPELMPAIVELSRPIGIMRELPELRLIDLATMQRFATIMGATVDDGLGHALFWADDCAGKRAQGVSVEALGALASNTRQYYVIDFKLPSYTVDRTDASGAGGFINLPHTIVTFEARRADTGDPISSFAARIFPGHVTYVVIEPDVVIDPG